MLQVDLSASEIVIEPGSTAQLTVTVINRQETDDLLSLEIEGVDVEWYALPVASVSVGAGKSQSAKVLFKISRSSECQAGTYPFVVRARSMETGSSAVQQAVLTIKPFSALQVELDPKRAAATFFHHSNTFDLTVTNLGNREETLDLYASDPEDTCAYEFETDRVTIKPGHARTVPIVIEPVTRPMLGSGRLIGFTVTARSVEDAYVSGTAHAQIERRALMSTAALAVLVVAVAVAVVAVLFRPRPIDIRHFTVSSDHVVAGQPVTLSWDVSRVGDGSVIQPGNIPVTRAFGEQSVVPTVPSTTYTLVVRAGSAEKQQRVTVLVAPPPPIPGPSIVSFTAAPARIHQGDTVTLAWKVTDATQIMLNPLGKSGAPDVWVSQTVSPEQTTPFVLTATGKDGRVVQKSTIVTVVPPNVSLAEVKWFRAKPEDVEQGKSATLSWGVTGAASVEIDNGVGTTLDPRGRAAVTPAQTTTYTLKATDNRGNVATRSVTVSVHPPPPPTPPSPPAGITPGGPTPGNP